MKTSHLIIFVSLFHDLVVPIFSYNILMQNLSEPLTEENITHQLQKTSDKVEFIFEKIVNLFDGDLNKSGYIAVIPNAIVSILIWVIIFLVLYHILHADKSLYHGNGNFFGQKNPRGRSIVDERISKVNSYILNKIERFARDHELDLD